MVDFFPGLAVRLEKGRTQNFGQPVDQRRAHVCKVRGLHAKVLVPFANLGQYFLHQFHVGACGTRNVWGVDFVCVWVDCDLCSWV